MNDFEKAILWLELVESGMSTLEASRKARELCGSLHENVGEWVEWLLRNNPTFC